MRIRDYACTALFIAGASCSTSVQPPMTVVNELLAADRAFGASGDLVTSLGAMFAEDVIMPLPQGRFARGRDAALEALRTSPATGGARAEWAPVRGGVSADGQHGFTFGFMTTTQSDGKTVPGKYLAYWVKTSAGWRAAAYKRGPRAAGDVPTATRAPSLPSALAEPTSDLSVIEGHRAGLIRAEKGFSDLAQRIGLGPAFNETGHVDAMNMGSPAAPDFVHGNAAIADFVSTGLAPTASPFTWSADDALAASSGDLGVTFGIIHQNGAPAGAQAGAPAGEPAAAGYAFFTIWRRESPAAPWKYIAE